VRGARLLRPARLLVLLASGAGVVYLTGRFDLVRAADDDRGMEPFVAPGSRFFVDRRPGLLEREDIVAVEFGAGRVAAARVAALPGDVVSEEEGTIFVNGARRRPLLSREDLPAGRVPNGELLVVRDRPEGSPVPTCERVPIERIRGLVVLAWPF